MLGRVNAGGKSYEEVAKDINFHLGGFSTDLAGVPLENDRNAYKALFVVRAKALHSKLPELTRIVNYILTDSDYTKADRLVEIVNENKAIWDNEASRSGNTLVTQR